MITRSSAGFAAGIVALAFFGAACSGASSPEVVEPAGSDPDATVEASADVTSEQVPDATAPAAEATDESADEADEVVEEIPPAIPAPETLQFTAPLVGGGEIDLAANFDNKPTLFWFWAPN